MKIHMVKCAPGKPYYSSYQFLDERMEHLDWKRIWISRDRHLWADLGRGVYRDMGEEFELVNLDPEETKCK